MRIEFINNHGKSKIRYELLDQLDSCDRFDFGSAFITEDGISLLRTFLSRSNSKNKVGRVLVGLYHCFNSKQTLMALSNLAERSNGRLVVHISKDDKFHWKYYHFEAQKKSILYIGSANLTGRGISEGGELQAKIVGSGNEDYARDAKGKFNREWEESIPIADIPWEKYEQSRQTGVSTRLHPEIRKLMVKKSKIRVTRTTEFQAVVLVTSGVSKRTERIVKENQSHWDEKGWSYYCSSRKREFSYESNFNCMLLIERSGRTFRFNKIHKVDKDVFKSPDGRYFIAFKKIGKTIRESKRLRQQLKDLKIDYHSRKFSPKYRVKKEISELFRGLL